MTRHEPQTSPASPVWDTDLPDAFLAGGARAGGLDVPVTAMTDLVDQTDWAAGPLGDRQAWPQSLRTAVDICLASRFPILLWWGPELVMIYNDAYRPMLGQTKHPRALGAPGRDVWTEIWPVIGPMLDHVMVGGGATWSTDQLLVLDRNGYPEESYFTFSYSPVHDESGEVAGVFTAVTETTERVLGERRLSTLAEMAGLMGAADRSEVVRTAATILGTNAADHPVVLVLDAPADGEPLAPAVAVEDRLPHLPTGTRARLTDLVRQVSGTGRPAHVASDEDGVRAGVRAWHAYPVGQVRAPHGAPAGVVVFGESPTRPWDPPLEAYATLCASHIATALADLHELAEERRLRQALIELDEAKSTFFTNISHELRTPLTLIGGPLQEAISLEVDPRQRRRLELVERSAHRLTRLVDSMLDFGRMEAGGLEPVPTSVDLTELTRGLAESFRPIAERAGLTFEHDCADGIRTVLDRDMFERVVLNLLTNSVKYTPNGSVGLTLRALDGELELAVRDSGIGIAADDVDRAFERFGRLPPRPGARSHEGAGLGLAMVRQLTELMGGGVTVCSEVGRGSTFTLRLPAPRPGTPAGAAAGTAASGLNRRRVQDVLREVDGWATPVSADGRAPRPVREHVVPGARLPRVVVAEDNADLRSYLGDVLGDLYDVELVEDGAAALAAVRRDTPDLVVADVMMPRLDGYALVEAIRHEAATSSIPVVLLSARAGAGETSTGLGAGADDYLVKPFSVVELRARVASNLERAGARTRDTSWRRAVMDGFHDALLILDLDGSVLELNDRFTALLGWEADEGPFAPPYPWDLRDADGRSSFEDAVDLARARPDGPESVETVLAHRDGDRVVGSVRVSVVDGGRRQPSFLLATVRDVTREHEERQRRAAAARLAAELSAADELTEVVAAAVAGLGVLFEGAATVRLDVGSRRHVFTASGPLAPSGLDARVTEALDAQPCEPPPHQRVDGILLTAETTEPECRVWVDVPTPRVVSADERIAGDLLVQSLALACDRVVAASSFAEREQHLRRAIESHEEIGQAVGILVERHRWTPTAAFERLKKASQDHNVRLREVAARVIDSGIDPDEVGSGGR